MLYILHGENTDKSARRREEIISEYTAKNFQIKRLSDWGKMTVEKLKEEAQTDGLFGDETVIVSEYLHSLPIGKRRTELIEELNNLYEQKMMSDLVLIEKKKLTALMLKKFPAAKVEIFEPSKLMWKFLGNFSFGDYQILIEEEELEPFYILTMLNRQINFLIQIKSGYPIKLAPFQIAPLKTQAAKFSLEQLVAAKHELVEIEYRAKTQSKASPLDMMLGEWLYKLL